MGFLLSSPFSSLGQFISENSRKVVALLKLFVCVLCFLLYRLFQSGKWRLFYWVSVATQHAVMATLQQWSLWLPAVVPEG